MHNYQHIQVYTLNKITTITLNRPDRLNAWTPLMADEVHRAIVHAGNHSDSRCIVITGEGRGFCAGADMAGLQDTADQQSLSSKPPATSNERSFRNAPGPDLKEEYAGRFGYFYECPKPIIAAINGACAGIGLVLTLYADLRFADANAKFTTAFAARGLVAEHGIAWLLPRLIGEANALDLLFTSRKFTGEEAADLGLVNKALSTEDFMSHVMQVASTLVHEVSPRSVAVMKRQIRQSYTQNYSESLEVADAEMNLSFSAPDFKEGVDSFVERRAPMFRDIDGSD